MSARPLCGTLAVSLLLLAGCGGTGAQREPAPPLPAMTDQEAAAREALYWQRQDASRADFTEADVQFMTGMIGHHAQALIMSRLAPGNGASEDVQTLAARIINAQQDEIESMQRWLRERGQPVPEVHIDGLTLMLHTEGVAQDSTDHGAMNHGAMNHGAMGHGGMDHSAMPGMLSQAQLAELAAAHGATFDRLFLTYMIQHHGGAITMVDALLAVDGAAQDGAAFKLASDINADQTTEIARMEQMLQRLR